MRTRWGLGLLAVLVVCLALLIWPSPVGEAGSVESVTGPDVSATDDPPSLPARSEVASGRLALRVEDGDGQPLPVVVSWQFHRNSPVAPRSPREAIGSPCEGSTEIVVPPGHWTWLCARTETGATAWQRVAPFSGRREETLTIAAGRHTVHVFALAADLSSPAGGAEVRAFSFRGDSTEPACIAVTDVHGYAAVHGLADGDYAVCLGDADPLAMGGETRRVRFWPHLGEADVVVVLVAPDRTRLVEVVVHADFTPRPGIDVALLLRRADDGSGSVVVVTPSLRPGDEVHPIRVPTGTWLPEVMPQCELDPGETWFPIVVGDTAPGRVAIALREPESRVGLELRGIHRQYLPLHVGLVPADAPQSGDPTRSWIGPYWWRRLQVPVALPTTPHFVVAHRSNGVWISRRPITAGAATNAVDMDPATLLEVQWPYPEPARFVGDPVWVEHGGGVAVTTLSSQLTRSEFGECPGLMARTIVPRGSAHVRITAPDGTGLWDRRIDLETHYVLVSRFRQ